MTISPVSSIEDISVCFFVGITSTSTTCIHLIVRLTPGLIFNPRDLFLIPDLVRPTSQGPGFSSWHDLKGWSLPYCFQYKILSMYYAVLYSIPSAIHHNRIYTMC